ncbi:SOS response-associated protein yoqW [Geodia barretti]|uniref:Abasic site processing protein HMCES n=1 Tax=Geodia barretti TaxID=519541 RepID=A0AA35SII8_GEOBA|nr:SOS response-associated protein yoqW [Geodia barretti]
MFHEPFVLFGYLAGITTSIELVTAVLILGQRQTALVAKQAAQCDVLSNGRLRLGVGVGWNHVEYEALGEDFHTRGARQSEQIEFRFGFETEAKGVGPRYNVAPTQQVLTVVNDGEKRGEMMRWGLVPSWAKDIKIGNRMINAISGEPMALAGLWETWKSPDDEWICSCTILTTAANSFIEPVHNRMPVILSTETVPLWLDPLTETPDNLQPLLLPAPSELLDFREVSPTVNNVRNDNPGCIEPAIPTEEVRLFR